MTLALKTATFIAAILCVAGAHATDWSDNSVGLRIGNNFTEPGDTNKIGKTILNFTHVSGDRLGANYFTIDMLASDSKDPAAGGGGGGGAQEFYGVYQRSYSIAALSGNKEGYGFAKDLLLVGRIDLGAKNDAFASRTRKLWLGVSAALPVRAGFFTVGALMHKETNHNGIVGKDVNFKLAPALTAAWSVPVGAVAAFGGFAHVIGPKGKNGFGADTKAETLARATLMFDIAGSKSGIKAGFGLEYWKNKYGNNAAVVPGAKPTTGLLLTEFHL